MDVFRIKLFFIGMVRDWLDEVSLILMYWVGVDDGHFQKVLDNEIRALQNACKGSLLFSEILFR